MSRLPVYTLEDRKFDENGRLAIDLQFLHFITQIYVGWVHWIITCNFTVLYRSLLLRTGLHNNMVFWFLSINFVCEDIINYIYREKKLFRKVFKNVKLGREKKVTVVSGEPYNPLIRGNSLEIMHKEFFLNVFGTDNAHVYSRQFL